MRTAQEVADGLGSGKMNRALEKRYVLEAFMRSYRGVLHVTSEIVGPPLLETINAAELAADKPSAMNLMDRDPPFFGTLTFHIAASLQKGRKVSEIIDELRAKLQEKGITLP